MTDIEKKQEFPVKALFISCWLTKYFLKEMIDKFLKKA